MNLELVQTQLTKKETIAQIKPNISLSIVRKLDLDDIEYYFKEK